MRRFVIIGQSARASDDFSLDDFPGTSGRLDVLARCLRAAMLVSQGMRRDVVLYLVLMGGPRAPRTIRIDSTGAKFMRPDERSAAVLIQKTLMRAEADTEPGFVEQRHGVAVARGGLECVLADIGGSRPFLLEEAGEDVRRVELAADGDSTFFIGDHVGFSEESIAMLAAIGAKAISVGPLSLHSDDVVGLISNELDRRTAAIGRSPW